MLSTCMRTEMRTSLDEAMVNLIELLQHLASPSTSTESKLKSTISQVNSALNNSDSFVRNRHYQCQQECESLSMQISNGEYKLLNLEYQLREIATRQAVLEQSLSEKKYLISEYENKKRNAQSERNGKEMTFGRALAGGILTGITFGIALPFIVATVDQETEERRRLGREINRYQEAINELNGQLNSIRNEESQLKAMMTEVQYYKVSLVRQQSQYVKDLQATAKLSTWISEARTLVSSLYGQATVMYEMNRQEVFLASVKRCIKDLMQILDENGSLVSSVATPFIVGALKNEWQALNYSIQNKGSSGDAEDNHTFLM